MYVLLLIDAAFEEWSGEVWSEGMRPKQPFPATT